MPKPKHQRSDPSARHRKPDQPGDTVTSRGEARSKPDKPRRAPSYRRSPIEIIAPHSPASRRTVEFPAVPSSPAPQRRTYSPQRQRAIDNERRAQRAEHRAGVLGGEATEYARRAAIRASGGGKPSVVGRAGAGAAAGAGAGAAVGSLGGPVGTAVGAGAGAVVGGAGGGISGAKAKREYRRAMSRQDTAGPRKLLVAEFLICTVVAALSPLTDEEGEEKPGTMMKRLTAIMGLFFLLGLISAAGRSSARAAAGFGGLLTVALLISQRSLFRKITGVFEAPDAPADTSQGRQGPPLSSATPRPGTVGL